MKERTKTKRNPLLRKKGLPMFDIPFLVGVFALLFVGLAMLFSAGYADALNRYGDSYHYIKSQLFAVLVGLVAMLVASFVSYKFYRRFVWLFYGICIALLIAVLIFGKGEQKRWLNIGFQFQPSEIAKVSVIMVLADYISRNRDDMKKFVKGIIIPCFIWGVPCLLVAVETHLSGAILIAAIGIVMMIAGGCRLVFLAVPAAGAGILGTVLAFSVPYMKARIDTWLNPETDLLGDGWQVYQSLTTIGSGGLFGFGYGKSRQKYLYMSEPQNDFIFSIVCEELGFIGAVFVIALFAFFIWRGIYIAIHAPNTFSSLIVIGIIGKTAVQVIFNIAVVTGSVPVTGVPLPFFSFGGTALTVLLAEIGLVLYISRFATVDKGSEPVTESDGEAKEFTSASVEESHAEEGNV
ncbi:MAG: putative lipid II flippase FtsW [Clostridiales bacterium]|nr:putative lipid II flippase FtsW [Clostridiales bacterium]